MSSSTPWRARETSSQPDPGADPGPSPSTLLGDRRCDVVVVGGGITGCATALLLARAGREVVLLEALDWGSGTTGRSTAKVTLLHGMHVARVHRRHGTERARAYVAANQRGFDWLADFAVDHEVDWQWADAWTVAETAAQNPRVRAMFEATRAVGLGTEYSVEEPLPFRTHGGVRLARQGQVDPLALVSALVAEARRAGAVCLDHTRALKISTTAGEARVETAQGVIVADHVVSAAGAPLLDRSGSFAQLSPVQSYALAREELGEPVPGMFLTAGEHPWSIRSAPGGLVITGGAEHVVGRGRPNAEYLTHLRTWSVQNVPGGHERHHWSARDFVPAGALPHVAGVRLTHGRAFEATGFAKWGLTNGAAAALALSETITSGRPAWAEAVYGAGPTWSALATTGKLMATSAKEIGVGAAEVLGRADDRPGCTRAALCTHLGGVLRWNDVDESWDCPLHGSRFAPDGSVLEGPATAPLAGQPAPGQPSAGQPRPSQD